MRVGLLIAGLCVAAIAGAQTPAPTPKDCTGLAAVVWEQPTGGGPVEWWQLVIAGTPQPTWPVSQCTPVPSPTGGTGAPAYAHPIAVWPTEPFWLLACNSDGCSDPSNVRQCICPTDTPTMTATATATLTPTRTVTPVPTNTKKPKPHAPAWLDWMW